MISIRLNKRRQNLLRIAQEDERLFEKEWNKEITYFLVKIKRVARKQTKPGQVQSISPADVIDEAMNLLFLCGKSHFSKYERQTRSVLEEERNRQISFVTDRRLYQYRFSSNRKAPWNT